MRTNTCTSNRTKCCTRTLMQAMHEYQSPFDVQPVFKSTPMRCICVRLHAPLRNPLSHTQLKKHGIGACCTQADGRECAWLQSHMKSYGVRPHTHINMHAHIRVCISEGKSVLCRHAFRCVYAPHTVSTNAANINDSYLCMHMHRHTFFGTCICIYRRCLLLQPSSRP